MIHSPGRPRLNNPKSLTISRALCTEAVPVVTSSAVAFASNICLSSFPNDPARLARAASITNETVCRAVESDVEATETPPRLSLASFNDNVKNAHTVASVRKEALVIVIDNELASCNKICKIFKWNSVRVDDA